MPITKEQILMEAFDSVDALKDQIKELGEQVKDTIENASGAVGISTGAFKIGHKFSRNSDGERSDVHTVLQLVARAQRQASGHGDLFDTDTGEVFEGAISILRGKA